MYAVYAIESPTSDKVHIGDLYLKSKLEKSFFGDKYMFFKHQDMVEDVALKPEWKTHVAVGSSKSCPFSKAQGVFKQAFDNIASLFQQ